jgi:pimeloyl-ACP methyl ester carboxylesterase
MTLRPPGSHRSHLIAAPGKLGARTLRERWGGFSVRPMTTFVLVHGAWGGSWGFRLVRGPLRDAGHEVFTPSLTGIGERSHLASPQVNLSTHVLDVVNTILYEDLTDIVLLGFSYGGMVVTGALEHIADRVSHLVYLDAFVPADGQSLDDLSGAGYRRAVGPGATWLVQPLQRPMEDADAADWSAARRSPHPVGCFTESVRLERALEEYPFTRTYVKATLEPRPAGDGRPSAFWTAADHAKTSREWRYREVDSDHLIPLNRPADLVALLLELT